MNRFSITAIIVSLTVGAATQAQETPQLPTPGTQHEWLQQMVGDWEVKSEIDTAPGEPPLETEGTESIRAIGGFWIHAELRGEFLEMPFTGLMTLGYDNRREQFVGTWIDSINDYLWTYEGSLDDSGKVLTLEAEGPSDAGPDVTARYRDVIEIKAPNHKVLTSFIQGEDGTWTRIMQANYHRVSDE